MKKYLSLCIGIATFAVVVVFNISTSFNKDAEIDLFLANAEALAQSEGLTITCTYGNCAGGLCHEWDNYLCPCKANGEPLSNCHY